MAVDDSYTKVLLHFEGADGSTTITDESGKTWNVISHAQIDTAEKKFGSASLLLDGADDFIYTADHEDFNIGSGDFTIDLWIKSSASDGWIWYQGDAIGNAGSISLMLTIQSGKFVFCPDWINYPSVHQITSTTGASGSWQHLAVVRTGNTFKLFVNGVQEGGDLSYSSAINDSNQSVAIGSMNGAYHPLAASIDEVRFSKGIARWTTNFPVPTRIYDADPGNDSYTKALLHFDGMDGSQAIADAAGKTWTASGNAALDDAQKVFGATSIYFDGSGDYIQANHDADFCMDAGDFTIDFHIRRADSGAAYFMGDCNSGGMAANSWFRFSSDKVQYDFEDTGSYQFLTGATSLSVNTWYHVAIVRFSNSLRLFVNGIQEGTPVDVTGKTHKGLDIKFGIGIAGEYAGAPFKGWIDEFRISKGIARWMGNFAVPSGAYPTPAAPENIYKQYLPFRGRDRFLGYKIA